MVTITHRVTDVSQIKIQAQDNGICVSMKEGEWVWLAREAAFYLGSMLELTSPPPVQDLNGEDLAEEEYEVTYQMADSSESHKLSVQAISETDALAQFYENVPKEYQGNLGRVNIQKKD
jgi:hypothetical protein